jgi:tetratricopeptide (TPR) repeat protein
MKAIGTHQARLAAVALCFAACGASQAVEAPKALAPAPVRVAARTPAPPVTPPEAQRPAADGPEVQEARELVAQGTRYYHLGDYARAEASLKDAMTRYPFLAEANLVLGKIFLIRASASRDKATLDHARLMFEMARALDPNSREAGELLQLFKQSAD